MLSVVTTPIITGMRSLGYDPFWWIYLIIIIGLPVFLYIIWGFSDGQR